jgi:AraC-like DNA-binding protein
MIILKEEFSLKNEFPFELFHSEMPPYYNMDKTFHWHDCLEISYVKRGSGKYYIENREIFVEAGDIIIINNIEPHYLEVFNEGMCQPVIIFNPSLICSSNKLSFDYNYLQPFFDRGADFPNKLTSNNPFTQEIMSELIEIEHEYENKNEAYQLVIKSKLLTIMAKLIRNFIHQDKSTSYFANKRISLIKIQEVMEYINAHFSENITLNGISSRFYVSPQYLSTIFKRLTGINFLDYLNNTRINHALFLLQNTDKKIVTISGDCGFNNTNHFNNTFKKITGKTPSEYRAL